MSFETCFVNLNMIGKLPNAEIREDAAVYEERGMPREEALKKATEERLTMARAQLRTITVAVREAWEAQGGQPRPARAPAAQAPQVDPAPTARPEAPPERDTAPMADLNDMFVDLLAEEAAAKPPSDDLNAMFGELLAEVSGVDPRPTVAELVEAKPKKPRAAKAKKAALATDKKPYEMVEEVNANWRKLYRENAGWFTGDGPYKLKADAPADVKAAYKAHLAAKKEAQAAMDAPPSDKPLADAGLTSYRYNGPMGPVMIGAKNDAEALKQASSSITDLRHEVDRANLQVWDGKTKTYMAVDEAPKTVRLTAESHIRKYAKTPGAVPNEQVRKVLLDAGPMMAEVAATLGEEPHLVTAVGKAMDEFGYKFTGFDGLRPTFSKPVSDAEAAAAAAKRDTQQAPDMEALIKVAADSLEQLRKVDVLRVLESNPRAVQPLAQYIAAGRPDLAQEVGEVMRDELGHADWKQERGAGEAAVSAVKNLAGGTIDAIDALGALFGGNSTLGSGPVFNEETYAKAKPLFKEALAKYGQAGQDIRDAMRTIIKKLLDKFGYDTTANMQPYVVRYIEDYRTGKLEEGENNVADGTAGSAQGDPQHRPDGHTPAERDLFNVDTAGAGGQTRAAGAEPDQAGSGSADSAGVSGRDAATDRAPGDQRVRAPESGSDGSITESRDSARSGKRGSAGTRPDAGASGRSGNPVTARPEQGSKLAEQAKAAAVPVKLGDRANIDATLPYLLDAQRDDVAFAEARFTAAGKMPGVLFTNGTGTGKTFSGLGILARQIRAGKTEGMILVPNNQIAQDWIESGKRLGVDIKMLDSKSENGRKGATITTYANFGDNPTLADRDYDWLLADESHYLMASKDGDNTDALGAFRALTRHPQGFAGYSRMRNRDLYDQLATITNKESDAAKALFARIRKADEKLLEQYAAVANTPAKRPKAIFLSATPFAYVKNVDYAEGYLFDYPADGKIGNSNQSGRAKFFVQHFGYRIRHHKLTEPDGNVDPGLMARQFNSWLRKEGALSARMLDEKADYGRRFVMVESALGTKIDEGMEFMREHPKYKHLYAPFMKEFTYLKRRYLLEAIKAREALPMIQQHLDLGRKVVVIHDYKKGGASNPFLMAGINGEVVAYNDSMSPTTINLAELVEQFKAERPDLVRLEIPRTSALQTLTAAHPDALIHNGDVSAKQLEANKRLFNGDDSGRNIIILQSDKGREGISLHDTTGKHQRVEVVVGMAAKPTALIQLEGRIYRTGQVTDAAFDYVMTGTMWERWTFAQTIAERADIAEALAMGEDARALKDAIIEAFENAGPHDITPEDGKGGKARDRQAAKMLTDWDRARSFYYGQVKRTSASKSAEGKDYFATPEPLGLKMVEWADIRPGEDVLEPSAGHGAIARWFPTLSNKTINEVETELITRTRLVVDGGARFLQGRFEDINIVNKYDAIVMNPPFGVGGSMAIPHLAKAYQHLRTGGRIVALLPRGPAADGKLEKFLYGENAPKDLYMVADINLPQSTFARAGAGVMTHVVILDKISDPAKAPNQVSRDYVSAEDIDELFERIENSTVPGRVKNDQPIEIAIEEQKVAPKKQPREAAAGATGAERYYAQFEFDHTKTGVKMYGAAMLNRTSMDTYKEAAAIAKQHGGYYNKFVGGGALRGFLFKSDEDRAAFMAEAGHLAEVSEGLDEQNSLIERRTRSIEVEGERRPIVNSNGRSVAPGFTEQMNFWKWFGQSKLTDASGRPRVLYHGTRDSVDRFDLDHPNRKDSGWLGTGVYLGDDVDLAESYARLKGGPNGPTIMPLYARLENPYMATLEEKQRMRAGGRAMADKWTAELKEKGHDGVILTFPDESREIVIFDPAGVKSATGNNGQYDPANPDILASSMPVFYSALARTVPAMAKIADKAGKVGTDQARLWLMARQKEGKFKADELQWSGVDDWLKAKGGKVSVDDITLFLEENGVQVEEVSKGEARYNGTLYDEETESFGFADIAGNVVETGFRSDAEAAAAMHRATDYVQPTKYSQYVLPGGENYRELLLTLPSLGGQYAAPAPLESLPEGYEVSFDRMQPEGRQYSVIPPGQMHGQPYGGVRAESPEHARADALSVLNSERHNVAWDKYRADKATKDYSSSHWDEKNIVAHIRFNDRVDADGKRVLFIEELQSDWGQQGLKEGFKGKTQEDAKRFFGITDADWARTDEEGRESYRLEMVEAKGRGIIPAAPFVTDTKAWLALGIKRMIRYAAENGYDRVAFVNGQQSADRYDLSKSISRIEYEPITDPANTYEVAAFDLAGKEVMREDEITIARVEEMLGKEIAQKIADDEGTKSEDGYRDWRTLSGLELKVGGEGMKTFYDKIVPQTINDVLKKLGGGKAGTVELVVDNRLTGGLTYSGPTKTADELTAFLRENKNIASSLEYQISTVRNKVIDGQPYAKAMEEHASPGAAQLLGGKLADRELVAKPHVGFDITPELRTRALDGLPLFSKFDPARRQLLAVAAAAAMGDAKAGDVKLGKASAINAAVLDQRVSAPVERILRRDTMGGRQLESGQTSMKGAQQLREAMKAISMTGPKELRALAAQVAKLLPADGVMLTVDDRRRMNVHGVVELSPMVHMSLFTAEGRTGLTYGTLIHEALHVAVAARYRTLSIGMVRDNDAILGLSAPAAAKALEQFEAVWEEFRAATRGEKFANKDVELAVLEARGNPDEFFVRALTDPLLQTYMAGKRYEGKTLWARFKDWIKSGLFGLTESGTAPSWLDAALAASDTLAQAMGADKADFARMGAISRNQASRSSENSRASVQEQSPEFKEWFGDSKVVNERGEPLRVYHGTGAGDFNQFDVPAFFSEERAGAEWYTEERGEENPRVIEAYLSISNPLDITTKEGDQLLVQIAQDAGVEVETLDGWFESAPEVAEHSPYEGINSFDLAYIPKVRAALVAAGYDGIKGWDTLENTEIPVWIALNAGQIKSATGNGGGFDGSNPDIMAKRRALPTPTWVAPADTAIDRLRHTLQDKHIDMKQTVKAVREAIGDLGDKWDPYLQEELYHGRSATGFKSFLENELRPLLVDMQARGVTMEQLEEYLHMRHAEEANEYLAEINEGNPDGLAGVATQDAKDYLANLSPAQLAKFTALASRVDAIIKGTQQQLVEYGLEKQDTMDAWNAKYQHYVPLHREDMDKGVHGNGTGAGFSIRGPAAKARTGSKRAVVDIMANIAMARERAIVRGEKNRIPMALYGLALQSPNTGFWKPVNPQKNRAALDAELVDMGLAPTQADNLVDEPRQKRIGKFGMVESYVNVALRNAPHVVAVRINGEDRFLFFNKHNDRALRMAEAIKNVGEDQLDGFMGVVGSFTRLLAAMNTQYNPIFGAVNLVRDVGEGSINLSSTPIAGKQAEVLTEAGLLLTKVVKGRGRLSSLSGADAALWAEFQSEGGITGYRAMFSRSEDRAKELATELRRLMGNPAAKAGQAVLDWLSDYNEALENVTRLAAYKVAKAEGLTNQRAASLAKNLTVNFNRKGAKTRYLGALYAFFNAAVQGMSRMAETLNGPAGKKIVAGGILLGVLQALLLAMAGFDDEDIPEFIRAKNLIIPASWLDDDKDYFTVPLPLGFSFLPSIGRLGTEFALGGMKQPGRYGTRLLSVLLDTFNPLDSSTPLQMVAPTVVDPLAALAENKDFTGRAIAREDYNSLKPTPGHTRAKETASAVGKGLSWFFNAATGGTDYSPGGFSPTPDQIDYLIGQFTGGVGRELMKAQQSTTALVTGEDVSWNKVPLAGRFYSDANDKSAVSTKFYENVRQLAEHAAEIDGRREDKLDTKEYRAEHPEAAKAAKAEAVLRDIADLRRRRRHWLEKGDKVRVKEFELKIRTRMQRFNEEVEEARSTAE